MLTLSSLDKMIDWAATIIVKDKVTKKAICKCDLYQFKTTQMYRSNIRCKIKLAKTTIDNVYVVYL